MIYVYMNGADAALFEVEVTPCGVILEFEL